MQFAVLLQSFGGPNDYVLNVVSTEGICVIIGVCRSQISVVNTNVAPYYMCGNASHFLVIGRLLGPYSGPSSSGYYVGYHYLVVGKFPCRGEFPTIQGDFTNFKGNTLGQGEFTFIKGNHPSPGQISLL